MPQGLLLVNASVGKSGNVTNEVGVRHRQSISEETRETAPKGIPQIKREWVEDAGPADDRHLHRMRKKRAITDKNDC